MTAILNDSPQYVAAADAERDAHSSKAGDFANSGEIEKHMPMLMQMLGQLGTIVMAPIPGVQPGMQAGQSGMPSSVQAPPNPAGNVPTGGMPPAPGSPALPPKANSGMPGMDHVAHSPGMMYGPLMPEKKVLSEPCIVSQPMNESLRNKHSIGSYYFLK